MPGKKRSGERPFLKRRGMGRRQTETLKKQNHMGGKSRPKNKTYFGG